MSALRPGRPRADGVARLQASDRWAVLRLLRREAEHNAYLLAQVDRGAIGHDELAGPMLGYWRHGELAGVAVFGSNLVMSVPAPDDAVDAFADEARRARFQAWVAVGEDAAVDRFMDRYGRAAGRVRLERGGQRLYRLTADRLDPTARSELLRPADPRDVSALTDADRLMVREELGFDPFERDLDGYRQGWYRRVREGRSFVVGPPGGPLDFKVDQSAASPDVVQLAGIWTRPEARRRGLARGAVGELCHRILARVPLVTLYVHAGNHGAIRLYEGLGFEPVGLVRSVWFDV